MHADLYRTLPKPHLHARSGQARVKIGGRHVYLGPWESAEALAKYDRLIADYLANGRTLPPRSGLHSVADLADRYLVHAAAYYTKHGRPTRTAANAKRALELLERSGLAAVAPEDFGPRSLRAFQRWLAAHPGRRWSRVTINEYTRHVVAMFRWAVAEELAACRLEALQAVPPLRRGRSPGPGAAPPREPRTVRPVDQAAVDATLPHLGPAVAAMVRVQLLTGMRPAEVIGMRAGDVFATPNPLVWAYRVRPEANKTDHLEIDRVAWLGPRAMEILGPLLAGLGPDDPVFSPRQAELARNTARRAARRSPMTPSQTTRGERARQRDLDGRGGRRPGDLYTTDSYRRAIHRGCDRAFPPPAPLRPLEGESERAHLARLTAAEREQLAAWRAEHRWSPNQLRHAAATVIANSESLEVAGLILGHRRLETTVRYVQWGDRRPMEAAAKLG